MDSFPLQAIAHMHSDYHSKFGIPRQSGLVKEAHSAIIFEPAYRNADAVRGIEGFSHLWVLWIFSEAIRQKWSPTVRPPRLGGNTRMGVFATRSPFRPNHIGLSCVELLKVEFTSECGPVLHVGGADLLDGTPIVDIKPYVPYADSKPNAIGGFTDSTADFLLDVDFPEEFLALLPANKRAAAISVLSHDPRPSYHADPERIYGLTFAGFNIRFRVSGSQLTVVEVMPEQFRQDPL